MIRGVQDTVNRRPQVDRERSASAAMLDLPGFVVLAVFGKIDEDRVARLPSGLGLVHSVQLCAAGAWGSRPAGRRGPRGGREWIGGRVLDDDPLGQLACQPGTLTMTSWTRASPSSRSAPRR
jgi:hypothetical protein